MKHQEESNVLLASALLMPLALTATAAQKSHHQRTDKPNVIFIVADDLGYGDLGCYGAQGVSTPNVDKLAKEGTRFTDCHAVASISTPSRYSLLTGEYAWRRPDTDVAPGNAAMIIKPQQLTVADLFKSRGYATAAIGKWHLGLGDKTGEQDWNAPLAAGPGDLGFDYSYLMAATSDRVPCVFIENGIVANHDPSAPIEVSYRKPFEGVPTGQTNPELMYNLKPSHGHNMAVVNGIGRIGYMKGGGKALWKDENIADSITAHALNFIKRHADEPFMMYLCTNDVHVPRFPHQRFRGKSTMGFRGDAIAQFDWTVGQVTSLLKKLGLDENTLVILTSDNGPVLDDGYQDRAEELLGNHKPSGPFRSGKYSSFEGGTMVPFIARWPKTIAAGQQSDALISHIDLMATMASLLNVPIPQREAADSRDQLQSWLGKDKVGRDYVVEQSTSRVLSVRTKQWKYIEPSNGPKMITWGPKIETGNDKLPQLYNLNGNPYETTNVAAENPETVSQMQAIIQKERTAHKASVQVK